MQQARKRFGQHFLNDPRTIQRIVAAVHPAATDHIVEIGPGRGAFTLPLLERVGKLDAVELDRDLIPSLRAKAAKLGELIIHQGDVLKFDFCSLAPADAKLRVVGNLPYNISTPVLFHLLEQRHCLVDIHAMLQKEVVDRLAASPGGKAYGRLSVMVQCYFRVTPLFDIPPEAFTPPPRVHSSFVRILPVAERERTRVADTAVFSDLVARAFGQRRKTLRNSIGELISPARMRTLGIDPQRRPETLSVVEFAALANALANNSMQFSNDRDEIQ